jgi:NAD(P)-dependent dehydrogenase (short-subunit alcohol dehydrogenase family)
MIDDLAGKVSVVTGAAQGIGLTVAKQLLGKGAIVYLADIEVGGFDELTAKYGADKAIPIHLDVTIPKSWSDLLDVIERDNGRLDVLVNNAGISPSGSIESTDFEMWRTVLSVNLDSIFLGCNVLFPLLKKSSSASIINLSSMMGIKSDANLAAYSASKGGVRLLTKSIALHGAQYKIRCNSVHPGGVRTRMLDEFIKSFGNEEEAIKLIAASVPLATIGEPEDVSNMILFLASEASKWITGAEMCVDGGATLT